MIKIDFYGSTHGHFLEYVTNVWIMQTAPSKTNIFKPPTYSAHAPDSNYLDNRVIRCGHFSIESIPFDATDQVIRIVIDQSNDNMFFIALTNYICKAGDIGLEHWMLSLIPDSVRNDTIENRNQWYSRFNEREIYANHYTGFININNPVFNFPFESFFSFPDFCKELSKLSHFLNRTFFPDQLLYNLWSNFIEVNQGWQSYIKCNQLLEHIFSNSSYDINCNIIEQGWINFNLSKICQLFDGEIFDQESYPSNTQDMYRIIQTHLATLR